MLYRITVVLSALCLAMFALAGCGGGASPGSSLTVDSGSVTEATTIPEVSFDNPPDFTVTGKTPLFVSDSGPALYQLDEVSGLPVNADTDSITVEETVREDGTLEWRIIDVTGESRPLFTRLTYLDTGLEPDELYRGEWGGDARAIFAAIPTPENELEIVMCPISGEEPAISECAGKCFARLVMTEPDKTTSLAPQDKAERIAWDDQWHTFFPFVNPAELANGQQAAEYADYKDDYVAHWEGPNKEGYDNHVFGVDESLDWERDVLEWVYDADDTKVFSRTSGTYYGTAVDKTLKIRFYGNFHGDYNEDGMVTVGDITELAQNFGVMSDYAALQRASTNFSNNNPFNIQSAASVRDPYNKYDGSYDGYVSVQNCNGDEQRMQNLLTVAPHESLAQYGNDLSPIAVHYNESIAYWQVKYVNKTPPTERVDYAVYDTELIRADYDRSNYPNGTILSSPVYSTTPYEGPKYYSLAAPLNYILPPLNSGVDDVSRDLDPGTYDIYITPYDMSENAGEPTVLENYTISFTQCYEPPGKPAEPPYFDGTNSFTANPYSYSIASVVLEWNQARHYTHTYYPLLGVWMQDANPVPNTHFELYCRVADPNVTMDSAWISDATATDNFVHEFVTPNYSGIIMMPGYCPDDQDVYWQPGAQYAFYLVAVNDQTGETTPHPSGVITGYLSYDPTQPVWLPDEDNSTDTEDDILNWTFGVAPDGTPGYFVYYGYAVDRETGISGYRIYYSDGSTIIPSTTLSGDMFTDSDLNTMMQNRSSYVIQYPDDLVADDPYWEYLAAKRCFFVPLDSAADRYDDLYVLVTALNGEHYIGAGAYRDGDNESRNRLVHNLKERPDAGVFERMILSSELGGDVTRSLNPEFYSGDMAYMGWYEGIDATDEGLLVGHATMDEFSYGSSNIFYPNMAGWIYGQLTTSQYNPLDADEWNFYSKVALAGALPSSGQYAVALAPDSEISCEWVKDFWSCEYYDLPQASVAYNVLSADSLVEDPDQSYLIGKAIYGLTTAGEHWGRVDYPYSILPALINNPSYPGMDLDTFGFPTDLAPYSFGFPYSNSPINSAGDEHVYFPTLMDVFDITDPVGYGFFHPVGTNYDQHGYQLDDISVYQSLRTGEARHIMMETTQLNPISYFDTIGTKAITLWGGSTSSTSNMNLDLYWHEYNDIYAPSAWDNTILPSDSALPDSWTYGLPQSMNLVSGTSSSGLIPVHATTAKDGTFYILVNEMEGGEPVLKLYTTFASGVYTETTLTDFPDISAMQDDMCYRDLLDVQFGASLLEQRNGNFTTFTQDSGKWIGIEDSGEASEFAELEPLCFAFVNYNNVSGVGTIRNEVWYGEAYFSTEGTAVWLELVDDIVIAQGDNDAETNGYPKWVDRSESNPNPNPHNGQTIVANSFNPLWVSLGMTQYDENFADLATGGSLERAIPVLAYGVSCLDATEGLYGQLKIAAPISFSVTPLDLTLDVYRSEIHQYDTGYTGDDYSGSTTESPGLSTIIQ